MYTHASINQKTLPLCLYHANLVTKCVKHLIIGHVGCQAVLPLKGGKYFFVTFIETLFIK